MRIFAVIEDERDRAVLQNTIEHLLPDSVFSCYASPFDALPALADAWADVAFLDVMIQHVDGFALAARLRAVNPKVNIIFIAINACRALDAFNIHASGYILTPFEPPTIRDQFRNLRYPVKPKPRLRAQCFGHFEIFADGKPLAFSRSKTKEMLAYLISCRGAACTNREITAVLWEDRPHTETRQSHFRLLVADLTNTLRRVESEDLLLRKKGWLAIDMAKIDCDFYDYLQGDPSAVFSYTGEFMTQYDWAEANLGYLDV